MIVRIAAVLLSLAAMQAPVAAPNDPTAAPAGAAVAAEAIGRGVQLYRCERQGDAASWVLVEPRATLNAITSSAAEQTPVGQHSAGPLWRWKDGSAVTGKVLQKQPAPDGHSIPWLLLSATRADDATGGVLEGVVYVRRSNTVGGSAPTEGCDSQHAGTEAQVRYSATYTFYRASTAR